MKIVSNPKRVALLAALLAAALVPTVVMADDVSATKSVSAETPTTTSASTITSTPAEPTLPVVKKDAKLDKALLEALQDSDAEEAAKALQDGADPNARGKDGVTPLHIVVPQGRLEWTTKLLDYKADPNAVNKSGQSALHLAIAIGAPPKPKKKKFGLGGLGSVLGGAAAGSALSGGLASYGTSAAWAGNLLGGAGLDSLLGANLDGLMQGGVFNLAGSSPWSAVLGTALQGDFRSNGAFGLQGILGGGGLGSMGNLTNIGSLSGLAGIGAPRLDAAGWMGLMGSVKSANPQLLGVMGNLPGGANAQWSQFLDAASSGNRASVEALMADPNFAPMLAQAQEGFAASASELPGNAAKGIITALLLKGANRDLKDKDGKTALDLARDAKRDDLVTLLSVPAAPAAVAPSNPAATVGDAAPTGGNSVHAQ